MSCDSEDISLGTSSNNANNGSESKETNLKEQIKVEKGSMLNIEWRGYEEHLNNLTKSRRGIQNKLIYGKTYSFVLETGNAQDLMKVSSGGRVHTLRDLSILSKYTGCFYEWMKIVKKYQLKWKNENYNSLNTFKNVFGIEGGSEQSLSQMIYGIKSSIK